MKDLLSFINMSPTAFNATANFRKILLKMGYEELREDEHYQFSGGGKYFVCRNMSSIMAFTLPKDPAKTYFKITASHTDCPSFKVKPLPIIKGDGFIRLNTEKYGGAIHYTWFDRPLSLAGRLIVKEDRTIKTMVFDLKEPFAIIPSLAIHMNGEVNKNFAPDLKTDLIPLLDLGDDLDLNAYLGNKVQKEVIGYDLYLYPCQTAVIYANDRLFSSFHIDNLECAYLSFKAFIEARENEAIKVWVAFDNEEVGSLSRQGADSDFLYANLKRITQKLNLDFYSLLARSFVVSCDNAHALHPNHPEKADRINRPMINKGIVIKHNANQSYTSDALSTAVFTEILKQNEIPYQFFTNRSDMRGGSTLGNIANSHLSILSIDIGLAQLAMHSCFETAGLLDAEYLYQGLKCYYNTKIVIPR